MVRINCLEPSALADQHLNAEYVEILMLVSTFRKHVKVPKIPESFRLGKGHITFFRDKLGYIKNRHELVASEMGARGFKNGEVVTIGDFPEELCGDWAPSEADADIVRKRIIEKLEMKPEFYRYRGQLQPPHIHIERIRGARPA